MASLTQWTWVWRSSVSWWWTGKPGMLQSMGLKESDMTKQLNWTELNWKGSKSNSWFLSASIIAYLFSNCSDQRPTSPHLNLEYSHSSLFLVNLSFLPCTERIWRLSRKVKKVRCGASLAAQWLRLHTSNAGDTCSIPGQTTKILHSTWHGKKKEKVK